MILVIEQINLLEKVIQKLLKIQDPTAIDTQRLAIGKEGQGTGSPTGLMPAWDTIDKQEQCLLCSIRWNR